MRGFLRPKGFYMHWNVNISDFKLWHPRCVLITGLQELSTPAAPRTLAHH